MRDADVLEVLDALRAAGAQVWIAGGWGIDALLREQTRPHRDLDLLHRREQEPAALAALAELGFAERTDLRPVRFVLVDGRGRELDLHPLVFGPDGDALQESHRAGQPFHYPASCFVTGTIGGREVPCLSVAQQVSFHQGYEPAERDRQDMARLRAAFGVETHF
ncbi:MULTISPECIES: amino acid transporter [Kitasatospora]|uniref:Amino acid transporter n=1 Tax=Kitasatospora setae (strain ATCC 33774 / DSM 43861 / JCM 3304 / KCC A-0304 / NBRC 14216 / KM-6054) TaxID=452652 RepID=E4NIT1_KITSK|nr:MULTISPECIES: amino acid transporter [Kitasatospora]BAJ32879.1 hypothetical protein KSE_71230 [Kitasatospora setae KM-6054]